MRPLVLLCVLSASALVQAENVLTLQWSELAGAVGHREATVLLANNQRVKGVVTAVEADALVLPSGRLGRESIRELRVKRVKGPRRAIGAAGAGAGAALGTLPWAISDSRVNVSDGTRVAQWAGITAVAAVAGYFIGRQLDTRVTVIRIEQAERR